MDSLGEKLVKAAKNEKVLKKTATLLLLLQMRDYKLCKLYFWILLFVFLSPLRAMCPGIMSEIVGNPTGDQSQLRGAQSLSRT
jgi:hypothetical protein